MHLGCGARQCASLAGQEGRGGVPVLCILVVGRGSVPEPAAMGPCGSMHGPLWSAVRGLWKMRYTWPSYSPHMPICTYHQAPQRSASRDSSVQLLRSTGWVVDVLCAAFAEAQYAVLKSMTAARLCCWVVTL